MRQSDQMGRFAGRHLGGFLLIAAAALASGTARPPGGEAVAVVGHTIEAAWLDGFLFKTIGMAYSVLVVALSVELMVTSLGVSTYVRLAMLMVFDAGVCSGRNDVDVNVSRVKKVRVAVPFSAGMFVTSLGAFMYDSLAMLMVIFAGVCMGTDLVDDKVSRGQKWRVVTYFSSGILVTSLGALTYVSMATIMVFAAGVYHGWDLIDVSVSWVTKWHGVASSSGMWMVVATVMGSTSWCL